MAEKIMRVSYSDEGHLAQAKDNPGSQRALVYNDDNNLIEHAELTEISEEELRERYSETSETDYEDYELDAEDFQRKIETYLAIGTIVAGIVHYASPYVKEWMQETAVPGVKTAFKKLKEKFKSKNESQEIDIVEVSLDVSEENSLAFVNQIEVAEKEYREKMTSEEARQKFLRIVVLAMELTKEVNELATADIQDEDALAKKDNWMIVEKTLTKESLLEGINNILESGEDAFTKEQMNFLQNMLGRDLYQGGSFIPIEPSEMQNAFDDSKNSDDEGGNE